MPFRQRDVVTAYRLAMLASAISLGWASAAHATVSVLQPVREAASEQPLELTLLYSDDDKNPLTIDVPKALNVTLTNGDLPPQPLALQREPNVPDRLTLRPGQGYGSVDAQFTYPLAKLISIAWGGYLWVGYFNGYGEDILDYNQRQHWIARIGYSIAR